MENKNNNPLPEDLVMQILLRLPVKSLVRFKCVCKSWLSLISDPNFAKSHFELFASHSNRLLYIPSYGSDAQSIDIETSLYDDSLNYSITTSYIGFRIRGSCRGFILLQKDSNFIIWNPSTGFHKPISCSPFRFPCYGKWIKDLYGFGYDVTTDDYLIVLRSVNRRALALQLQSHWEFFSVRTNSWKEIEAPHFPYNKFGDKSGVLFNGAIHSLVEYHRPSAGVIVVFDLIHRNVSQIPLPDCFIFRGTGCLMVLAGCLALCHSMPYFKLETWVMKEYNVHSSWTRLFVVPGTTVFDHFNPMCSTKGGQIIAIDRGQLVKVSDEGKLLESRTCFDYWYECNKAIYTESLMSLPNDHGEARDDDQQ